jgi:RimJ/RimL family protein N-acetyltransferase
VTVEIIRLPVESWKDYRDLRFRALKEDPEAYSSSYEEARSRPDESWKRRLSAALEGKDNWLLFAKDGEKLVGTVGAFLEGEHTDTATVVGVYVPREERGRGISRQLMEEMLRRLSGVPGLQRVKLMVNVDQLPAVGLYLRLGFRETGRQLSESGAGLPIEQMEMERPLPYHADRSIGSA